MLAPIPTTCANCGVHFPTRHRLNRHLCWSPSQVAPSNEHAGGAAVEASHLVDPALSQPPPMAPQSNGDEIPAWLPPTQKSENSNGDGDTLQSPAKASSNHIYVAVGNDASQQVFSVHKDLMCRASGKFKAMFENTGENHCNVEILSPTQFKIVLEWLYKSQLFATIFKDYDLLDFHRFAEVYQMPGFRRDTFLAYYNKVHSTGVAMFDPAFVARSVEIFPLDSPWCRFLVDLHAWHVFTEEGFSTERPAMCRILDSLPRKFLVEVLKVKSMYGQMPVHKNQEAGPWEQRFGGDGSWYLNGTTKDLAICID